jgi:hypothetical protein
MMRTPIDSPQYIVWTWCLLLMAFASGSRAQSQAESAQGSLYIQSDAGKADVVVAPGNHLQVRYHDNPKHYNCIVFQGAVDSAVVLNGDTIAFKYIDEIFVRHDRRFRAGKIVLWYSAGTIAAELFFHTLRRALVRQGGTMFWVADAFASYLFLPAALALLVGLWVGVVLLGRAYKGYAMRAGWRLSAQPSGNPKAGNH